MLQDIEGVSNVSTSELVDRSKIRRERQKKIRYYIKNLCGVRVKAIYFDQCKDSTVFQERKISKIYRNKKLKEHITLISYLSLEYLCYYSLHSG